MPDSGESEEASAQRGGAAPEGTAGAGVIRTREDVVRALDRICAYFESQEPSSPVPLLLRRARRLVSKDFMEILADIAPKGAEEAKLIGGLDREE